jgi:hypothetical protein
MCLRHSYYCHNCQQYFDIPRNDYNYGIVVWIQCWWLFCCGLCCDGENGLKDCLCVNSGCLRHTEEEAHANMHKRGRCNEACRAVTCMVEVFYMPCHSCFCADPQWNGSGRIPYSNPHRRGVTPQAVQFRPPSPPRSPPCFVLSFLPDLPPPYWSLSDAPLSYRWLAANHKFNCLEPGGRDDKFPVDWELCLPPEYVRVCETDFINEDPCIKFQKQDMSERLDNFCKKQTVCKQSIWYWFRKL